MLKLILSTALLLLTTSQGQYTDTLTSSPDMLLSGKFDSLTSHRQLQALPSTVACPQDCKNCTARTSVGVTTVTCTVCNENFTLNATSKQCMPQCSNDRQYLMVSNRTCISCPFRTFPDFTNQRCRPCGAFCNDCIFDQKFGNDTCLTCEPPATVHQTRRQCQLDCDINSYFDFNRLHCITAVCNTTNQTVFLNKTNNQCQSCPTGCGKCINIGSQFDSNNLTCLECANGYLRDPVYNVCRIKCNSSQEYWNVTDGKCRLSPNGTTPDSVTLQPVPGCQKGFYLDSNTSLCYKCQDGCESCVADPFTDQVICQQCSASLVRVTDQLTSGCLTGNNTAPFNWTSISTCDGQWTGNVASSQLCAPGWSVCQDLGGLDLQNDLTNFGPNSCYALNLLYYDMYGLCSSCNSASLNVSYQMIGIGQGCSQQPQLSGCGQGVGVTIPSTSSYNFNQICTFQPNLFTGVACCLNQTSPSGSRRLQALPPTDYLPETTCVSRCIDGSFFNLTSSRCQQCPNGTVPNPVNQTCDRCPQKNCSSCARLSFDQNDKRSVCTKCNNPYVLSIDQNQSCKRACPVNQIYNYTTDKCQSCPATFYKPASINGSIQKEVCLSSGLSFCKTVIEVSPDQNNFFSSPTLQCLDCRNDSFLDNSTGLCRPNCKADQFFNFSANRTGACQTCPVGTFGHQILQTCIQCPQGCTNCTFNNVTWLPECRGCVDEQVIDFTTKWCRPQCQNNSYWFFDEQQCVQCPEGLMVYNKLQTCVPQCDPSTPYYVNATKNCTSCPIARFFNFDNETCMNCSTNCTICNSTTACQQCQNGTMIDERTNQCKPFCPNNTQYNFLTRSCSACSAGTYYNATSQLCRPCPNNCTQCAVIYNTNLTSLSRTLQALPGTSTTTNTTTSTTNTTSSSSNIVYPNQPPANLGQGQVICSSCASGFIIDQSIGRVCRQNCLTAQLFNYTTMKCEFCPKSQYLNASIQKCLPCPINCQNCSMRTINDSMPTCTGCAPLYLLDPLFKQCRLDCGINSVFSFSLNQCLNCQSNQYSNVTTQACVNCPGGCTTCQQFKNTSIVNCTSCQNGQLIDRQRQLCRDPCDFNAFYNQTQGKCQVCTGATWMNNNTQSCQPCAGGCLSCIADQSNSSRSDCLECLPNFFMNLSVSSAGIVQKSCVKNCTSTQFYDPTILNCRNCSTACASCKSNKTCDICMDGFNLNSLGTCTSKCSTGLVWSSKLQQCLNATLNFTIFQPQKQFKCNDIYISSGLLGNYDNSTLNYSWSVNLTSAQKNQSWAQNLTDIIAQQQFLQATQYIVIPSIITEFIPDNTTLLVQLDIQMGLQRVRNTRLITIFPAAFQFMNFSSQLYMSAKTGGIIPVQVTYPQCQTLGAVYQLAANLSYCRAQLFSANQSVPLIKNYTVADYRFKPNELLSNQMYIYRLICNFPQQQSSFVDTYIQTYPQSTCLINNGQRIIAPQGSNLSLKVNFTIYSPSILFQLRCLQPVTGIVCPFSVINITDPTQFFVPASKNISNVTYMLVANDFATGIQETNCSIPVQTIAIPVNQTNSTTQTQSTNNTYTYSTNTTSGQSTNTTYYYTTNTTSSQSTNTTYYYTTNTTSGQSTNTTYTYSTNTTNTQTSNTTSGTTTSSPPQQFFNLVFYDHVDFRNYLTPSVPNLFGCNQTQDFTNPVAYTWQVIRNSDKALIYSKTDPNVTVNQSAPFVAIGNLLSIKRNSLTPNDNFTITCFARNAYYNGSISKTYTTIPPPLNNVLSLAISNTATTTSTAQPFMSNFTLTLPQIVVPNITCQLTQLTSTNQEYIISGPFIITAAQTLWSAALYRFLPQDLQVIYAMCQQTVTSPFYRTSITILVPNNTATNVPMFQSMSVFTSFMQLGKDSSSLDEPEVSSDGLNTSIGLSSGGLMILALSTLAAYFQKRNKKSSTKALQDDKVNETARKTLDDNEDQKVDPAQVELVLENQSLFSMYKSSVFSQSKLCNIFFSQNVLQSSMFQLFIDRMTIVNLLLTALALPIYLCSSVDSVIACIFYAYFIVVGVEIVMRNILTRIVQKAASPKVRTVWAIVMVSMMIAVIGSYVGVASRMEEKAGSSIATVILSFGVQDLIVCPVIMVAYKYATKSNSSKE